MMELEFSSLNPYQSLQVITEDSPQLLVDALKAIKVPIKIVQIVHAGTKASAYYMGDVRPAKQKQKLRG